MLSTASKKYAGWLVSRYLQGQGHQHTRGFLATAAAAADAMVEQTNANSAFLKFGNPIPTEQMGMNQHLAHLPETKVR